MLHRMGKQTKSNMGLDYRVLHLLLSDYEREFGNPSVTSQRKRNVVFFGAFFLLGLCCLCEGMGALWWKLMGLFHICT